jgi:hypothetical protein
MGGRSEEAAQTGDLGKVAENQRPDVTHVMFFRKGTLQVRDGLSGALTGR